MKNNVNKLIKSALFLAIAIVFQTIGKSFPQLSQFITGPIINAILLITICVCDRWWAVGVGILTPALAGLTGQLAAPLVPFIPFIMAGNALFILIFSLFINYKRYGKYIGIIPAAFLKFGFLYLSVTYIIRLFNIKIPPKVAAAMGVPQLVTALIGGVLACFIIEALKKRKQL